MIIDKRKWFVPTSATGLRVRPVTWQGYLTLILHFALFLLAVYFSRQAGTVLELVLSIAIPVGAMMILMFFVAAVWRK